jgi:glutaredoxin-like protein NrdH
MKFTQVAGAKKADIIVFALSTCPWCKKAKALLNELGVEYRYVDVDLAEYADEQEIMTQMHRWGQVTAFPTLVFNDQEAVVGFKPDKIKELIGG